MTDKIRKTRKEFTPDQRLEYAKWLCQLNHMKVNVTLEIRQIAPLAQFTGTNPLTLFNSSKPIFLNVR
jgi:hypothetical protein